ncbi:PRDM8 protein, partial [Rhadina sibilatrix]|nr:PRDM8 protein [Rhadina sibilatrix]
MEDAGVQRGIWDGDAKTVQQCLTDIFTSVYTTCDIPENAIFGPCVLSHTSLYDSIAFIALKSTDKRTVPYIFRVDTSAANGSSEGLMWLRLVQSAREREEQNLEAYIKSGQLFYRSLRRIAKDEELLVWYGKELTELLLLGPARAPARTNGGCTARPPAVPGGRKEGDPRRSGNREAAVGFGIPRSRSPNSRRISRRRPRLTVLSFSLCLSCPTDAGSPPFACPECSQRFQFELPFAAHLRFRCPKRLHGPDTGPAAEAAGVKDGAGKEQEPGNRQHQALHGLPQPGAGAGELPRGARRVPGAAGASRGRPRGGGREGEAALPRGGGARAQRGAGPLPGGAAGAAGGAQGGAGPAVAAAAAGPLQLQLPSALTLLPPSFTSLCLPAQNWCAKCNASFRMTSDLVYHMRSHHKKEYALEPLVKRRREEKLKCPICNESFRERHHLSRHMTSHN